MLFNSYAFIFLFLPTTLLGFYVLARRDHRVAAGWLAAASLVFYGYWSLAYLPLLCGSVLFNYAVGRGIAAAASRQRLSAARLLLVAGVALDLALLGYFKYADFFIGNLDATFSLHLPLPEVVLPIGISFFTFTQIAFLVDSARGAAREYSLVHYTLFVTYFPHLIAGPILHHKEMIPQFRDPRTYRVHHERIARGIAFFAIGLAKKVVFADEIAGYVGPVFSAAAQGDPLSFLEAWGGALAYTLQLYFDFSAYSDMAVGLSLLFNVQLPFNFNSPYKARNIIDFWRRWHMTLSRFLRDYLYIPLGGSRRGAQRRYVNLLLTMVLGGLWHGASWTFVAWGALHGVYLAINHTWHSLIVRTQLDPRFAAARRVAAHALTLLAVIVAWVFFRAPSIESAMSMLGSMFGRDGITLYAKLGELLPAGVATILGGVGIHFGDVGPEFGGWHQIAWIAVLLTICLKLPNTQELVEVLGERLTLARESQVVARVPLRVWAAGLGLLTTWCILQLGHVTEFLYFQF